MHGFLKTNKTNLLQIIIITLNYHNNIVYIWSITNKSFIIYQVGAAYRILTVTTLANRIKFKSYQIKQQKIKMFCSPPTVPSSPYEDMSEIVIPPSRQWKKIAPGPKTECAQTPKNHWKIKFPFQKNLW